MPSSEVINSDLTWPLVSTYEREIWKAAKYFADSCMEWPQGPPLESQRFRARKPMQINCHPCWWPDVEHSVVERDLVWSHMVRHRKRVAEATLEISERMNVVKNLRREIESLKKKEEDLLQVK